VFKPSYIFSIHTLSLFFSLFQSFFHSAMLNQQKTLSATISHGKFCSSF
jgi:hypothetical protein